MLKNYRQCYTTVWTTRFGLFGPCGPHEHLTFCIFSAQVTSKLRTDRRSRSSV
ncbi:hypothetical protein ES288_A04G023400v1 [Gossypium darwinii]|uniref:Uncharacterized protein n=1 Tax=Gossypium darwinii TaxID=34276 RepID=A0A5D2GUC1_GOSDA|nr:hypothetical protein ES288_A04G023400v1 [Gossypium darwinii]